MSYETLPYAKVTKVIQKAYHNMELYLFCNLKYLRNILLSRHHTCLFCTKLGAVFIPILKKGKAKECSNYHTIALISHASKVMLKILQVRLQQ